jgi:hypothetical protein
MGVKPARGADFADLIAPGAMGVKQCVDVAGPFPGAALVIGLELRRQVGALLARQCDEVAAERQLRAFEAGEAALQVAAGVAQAVGEDGGVDRGLGGAGADMRASDKRRIAGGAMRPNTSADDSRSKIG